MKAILLICITTIFALSCRQTKQLYNSTAVADITASETLNDNNITHNFPLKKYQGSDTMFYDLIHTKLTLSFDYKLKRVNGTAEIKLKPWFYSTNILRLDAQNFDIHSIQIIKSNIQIPVKYSYNNQSIIIYLDKYYTKNEAFTVLINYTAKPDEIAGQGSMAIRNNRGLYFIDSETNNPQIWTQGETRSNSCWFPTIDSPSQNMSQEIYLTVNQAYKTLSNGILISSLLNTDGTRTDYWKQDKPHAPYLAMIAVGKFEVIKDYWRDLPVFVYVEEKDILKAKSLFQKTYKMIDFYSKKLNYDFPWDKYSQVVVRDFVSGAMENTGAVVFGDYVLHYSNEEQRIEYECVVAHELAHHWFGDLVTCESWANLPLNESFATYFEYLWLEHEYGRDMADVHLEQDYNMYSFEKFFKDENLIRFHYLHRDDMFDAHSYQKGGIILHMLRYTVGEEAFWNALSLYLKDNEYHTVEIHHLRLAFEKVTGQDLNWFFNQWFLSKGIPELKITYDYSNELKKAIVSINQTQNIEKYPLYVIPTAIDIYLQDTVLRKYVLIDEQNEIFEFSIDKKPLFMNFDPENSILCKKTENYTVNEFIEILDKAPLYKDKNEALNALSESQTGKLTEIYMKLTNHNYWKFRLKALERININKNDPLYDQIYERLNDMVKNDIHPEVRQKAKYILKKLNK